MALPKKAKKIGTNIDSAVKKAAAETAIHTVEHVRGEKEVKKGGRPSLRGENCTRMTLILEDKTAERLGLAFVREQAKRRKAGGKLDKSLLIEEILTDWLSNHKY